MRLLNTTTLELEEFYGSRIPHYAILSHVWSNNEVSYEAYREGSLQSSYGYTKIQKLCQLSRDGLRGWFFPLQYVWIDTACIDKRSSAELSEAINKMYGYYERAEVCLVFLPDVDPVRVTSGSSDNSDITGVRQVDDFAPFLEDQFVRSKWFDRGWTLQELLAPEKLMFFNTSFEALGGRIICDSRESVQMATFKVIRGIPHSIRNGPTINALVMKATGISEDVLSYGIRLAKPCIAKRMSWAAHRNTTREEDIAYSLLGIFDVNMPLLYGEGSVKAFARLQMKILSRSSDESIFAWKLADSSQAWSGLLAPSPKAFVGCQNMSEIAYDTASETRELRSSYVRTKEGIELSLRVPKGLVPLNARHWIHPLRCGYSHEKGLIRRCCLQIRTKTRQIEISTDHPLTAQRWQASIFYLDGADEYRALKQAFGWGRPHLLAESFDQTPTNRTEMIGNLTSALSAYVNFMQEAQMTWREWTPALRGASNAIRLVFPYHNLRSEPYFGALMPEDRGIVNAMTLRRYTVQQAQGNVSARAEHFQTAFEADLHGSLRVRQPFVS